MNHYAPEGQVYVCGVCGKRSPDRHGAFAIDAGWDESCVLHAVLCTESSVRLGPDGLVERATAVGNVKRVECSVGYAK